MVSPPTGIPTTNSSSLIGHPAEHIYDGLISSLTNFLGSHVSVGHSTNTSLHSTNKDFPNLLPICFSRLRATCLLPALNPLQAEPSTFLHLWTPALCFHCPPSAVSSIKFLLTFHCPALKDLLSNVHPWFLQPSVRTFLPLCELSTFPILKPSVLYTTHSLS